MPLRRVIDWSRSRGDGRCGRGRGGLLSLCVVLGFTLELLISFSQPLPTTKIEFQKTPSSQYRELSDTYSMSSVNGTVHPRVVYILGTSQSIHPSAGRRKQDHSAVMSIPTSDCPYCQIEMESHIFPFERPYYDECTFMADWQSTFHESCNDLHALDILSDNILLLSTQGSWRTVWRVNLPQNKTAILKLLRADIRNFTHEAYAYHRTDANVMSQLTASPYIVNAYGFCGQSVMTEFASSGARDFVKAPDFSSSERLAMGRDLAHALAALHSIDYPHATNPTLAHNDINMANAVQVDRQLKLNDFNIGIVMKWNKTRPCGAPVRFEAPLWKSPEEVRNASYIDPALADVYGLGNLLFQVMSKHQPWTHLEPDGPIDKLVVAQRKMNGEVPFVPDKHKWSNKTALQALYYGTMACFRFDPHERLTSYELAKAFDLSLMAIKKQLKVPRAAIQRFFEKDFWRNATLNKKIKSDSL